MKQTKKKKHVSLVFWISLLLCSLFVLVGAIFPKQMEETTQSITTWIGQNFSWYYLLLLLAIFLICVYLLFSRYSQITLGEEGEAPEFSLKSWFAMLFSAGMGLVSFSGRLPSPFHMPTRRHLFIKLERKRLLMTVYNSPFFIGAFMHGRSTRSLRWHLHISTFIKAILD